MAISRATTAALRAAAFIAVLVFPLPSFAAVTTYTGVYAGGTISPGNTVLLNNGASVTGNVLVNGTLQFNQTGSLAISTTLSGSGTLSLANSGTLTLLATNTNAETTLPWLASLTAGRLNIGTSGTGLLLLRELLSVSGGVLISQSTRIVPWGQGWNVVPPQPEAAASVNGGSWINSGNLEVAAAARRSGRLTISNGGLVAVGGTLSVTTYTYTDSSYLPPRTYTTVGGFGLQSGGTLQIGLGGTTGVLGIAGLGFDGTLAFNRSNSGTYSGSLSGSGSVVQLGSGTWMLSGSNSYSGPTRVERGLLRLSGSHYAPLKIATGTVSLAGPYVLFGGNTSQLTASNLTVSAGAALSLDTEKFTEADISRLASLGTGSTGFLAGAFLALDTSRAYLGTYTYSGTLADTNNGMNSLALCKTGTGTLILSGSNSYSGGTVVESGTLKVTGAIRGNIRNNGTLVNARSGTVVWSGTISGTGALIQEGQILTLSGSNSYTGPTRTRYGELRLPVRQALYGGDTSKWTATNITTNSTLRISVGGPNEFTAADIDILKTLGTGSTGFVNDSWLALDTSNAASGTFTYSGALTNPNSGANKLNLMKTGSAVLVLLGSNSYTGATWGRDIQIGNGGSSGSIAGPILDGPFVFNSAGSLTLTGSSNLDAPYSSQPTPVFTKLGTGTMSLAGTVDCYDLFVVDGGVCTVAAGSQLRLASFGLAGIHVGRGSRSSGSLTVDGGYLNSRVNWLGSADSTGVIRLNSGTIRAAGSYSGNSDWTIYNGEIYINGGYFQGGFAMYGSGSAIISGGTANLSKALVGSVGYGMLAINGGIVSSDRRGEGVTVGKPLGGNGVLTVSGGDVNFPSLVVGEFGVGQVSVSGGQFVTSDTTLGVGGGGLAVVSVTGGTWTNSGNMTVGGSGTGIVVIGGSGGGGVLVVGGTITQGGDGSSISVSAGGVLQVGTGGTTGVLGVNALNNSGTLVFNRSDASSCAGAIVGPGRIVKQSAGTLTLTGSNSYTGGTTISSGTLQVGSGGTTGSIVGDVTASAASATFAFARNDSVTFPGIISGVGRLTQLGSGTLVISSSNSYSGGTQINAGTLVTGHMRAFGSGTIVLNGGAINLASFPIGNGITNNGGAVLNAGNYVGTQTVAGTVSLTGTIGGTVSVTTTGELKGNGTVFSGPVSLAAGARHSPGESPGAQTFDGGLSYLAGSVLTWEVVNNSNADAGSNYDFLRVTGGGLSIESGALLNLAFSGTQSSVSWSDPFWNSNHAWTLIDASAVTSSTGNFVLNSISGDSFGRSLTSVLSSASFQVGRSGNNVVLTYMARPQPADLLLDVTSGTKAQSSFGYLELTGGSSITKVGAGTLLLDGINTFTGTMSVQGGIAAISGSSAVATASLVDVAAGAKLDVTQLADGYSIATGQTLGGSGTILGSVTFGRGSTLSPGAFSTGIQGAGAAVGVTQILTVPEPTTLGLVGVGLGLLGLKARRRKRAA